jgi:uncharacterized protein (DUF433 family)
LAVIILLFVYNGTMFELKTVQSVPLTMWEDGSIRITGSRVPLDSVIYEFKNGATAEQIQEDYPSLHLKDIYGAIAYYLANIESVEEHLQQQHVEAGETKQFIESKLNTAELRERIRSRRTL